MSKDQIKPICGVKANAAQLLREPTEGRNMLVITQNGEEIAVMQDTASQQGCITLDWRACPT